ncbi:DUF3576 domain-containing protein [Cereibacter johrii]|uniref:Uncharacterized protein DUF3576 n=1 Tax=Cereibacter johrii TaxID=445629 RepID=A0ABX5JBV9_9RHOB|nr:DUF3576 domain-containing protein [Cereibacter johrii]QCP86602.1 DUF3576 domain-containing protein [Cereibacter sphaeroides]MEA5159718.1 DUF3576 domain-containing protein [Cereibacter johrii]ODM44707.1 hypothetical protein A9O63_20455 [Cereibacter johrii]PTM79311.1 uncharacterized protein DUF3576 [Cereibacter johrii]RAZ86271.1 DUF3576 domain-containing protein [Cereibacter johrii]
MTFLSLARAALPVGLALSLSACGGLGGGDASSGDRQIEAGAAQRQAEIAERNAGATVAGTGSTRSSLFDLFGTKDDPNTKVEVNKYIWNAALEVLNFLPVQSVDPFTGVISTGYGVPPGGGRAYRATIYVQDPALDARSLKVALQGQGGGPVSAETQRAVEDAILTRARQLRLRDSRL